MKKKSKVDFGAYAFLIPAAVIYLSVIVIPVFYSLFISLFKWNGVAEKEFVGLANYINLFTNDATFMIALKNNLIWIVLTIVLLMTVSLGFAVILNKQFRGRTVFRAFFYFPCVIAPIAVAIIWRWIYNRISDLSISFSKHLESISNRHGFLIRRSACMQFLRQHCGRESASR